MNNVAMQYGVETQDIASLLRHILRLYAISCVSTQYLASLLRHILRLYTGIFCFKKPSIADSRPLVTSSNGIAITAPAFK